MPQKFLVTISEEKITGANTRIFDISFVRQWVGLMIYGSFDLHVFNQKGYLVRFINNFKPQEKACYVLFSSFAGLHGSTSSNIDKILDMSFSYLTLKPQVPEKWTEKLTANYPNLIHFLILKDEIGKLAVIFDYIDSIDTRYDLIFAPEQDKVKIFSKIKELSNKNLLNEQGLLALGAEMVEFKYGKYAQEEGFRVITSRFDINQIKELLLDSIERENFKVVIK